MLALDPSVVATVEASNKHTQLERLQDNEEEEEKKKKSANSTQQPTNMLNPILETSQLSLPFKIVITSSKKNLKLDVRSVVAVGVVVVQQQQQRRHIPDKFSSFNL